MQILESIDIKTLIKDCLEKSMSYLEYRQLTEALVKDGSTTGNDKSEAMVEYTKLNDRRMKRWDKTLKISESLQKIIREFDGKVTWLAITETWCGDAAHTLPVMNKFAELNQNINLRLVLRDENDDLMNAFLTNGGKAIPKLIAFDEFKEKVLGTFGPRPEDAKKLVEDYKAEHGQLTPEFKQELQLWYNKNKGQSTIEDLVELLES